MYKMCKRFGITLLCMVLLTVMTFLLLADNLGVNYEVSASSLTELPPSAVAEKKRINETIFLPSI